MTFHGENVKLLLSPVILLFRMFSVAIALQHLQSINLAPKARWKEETDSLRPTHYNNLYLDSWYFFLLSSLGWMEANEGDLDYISRYLYSGRWYLRMISGWVLAKTVSYSHQSC